MRWLLWLRASVLTQSYETKITQKTDLMTLYWMGNLVRGDTSPLVLLQTNDSERKILSQGYHEDPSQANKLTQRVTTCGFQPT